MLVIYDSKTRNGSGKSLTHYLENGEDGMRSIKDKRVILEGDLKTFESVVEMAHKKGYKETYRTVVLSFGEDSVSEDTMRGVAKDFLRQYMSGYREDEYSTLIEAHLPKIKNKYDKDGNVVATRKPHIHVCIGTYNIKSDKALTLGNHAQRNKEIELWKKITENKYGLSVVTKNALVKPSHKLLRLDNQSKFDRIKAYQDVINEHIKEAHSVEDLKGILQSNINDIEYIKQSTQNARNPYFTIKLKSEKTADRLKGTLFSQATFSEAKERLIADREERGVNYYEVGEPRENSKEDLERLQAYYDKRFEYISKAEAYARRGQYEKITPVFTAEEKARILKSQVKTSVYEKTDDIMNAPSINELENINAPTLLKLPKIKEVKENKSSFVSSQISALKDEIEMKENTESNYQEFKKTLTPKFIFDNLNVQREKFSVFKKDGEYRIKCGKRNLNTHDFLTKEMNLSWSEAKEVMDKAFAQQEAFKKAKAKTEVKAVKYNTMTHQQRVLYSAYQQKVESNLKGYYVNVENDTVTIRSKGVNIVDTGSQIVGTGSNLQEQVKVMLDMAHAKGWKYRTLTIDGTEAFKAEVLKQIDQREKDAKDAVKKLTEAKKEFISEAEKQNIAEYLDGNEWVIDRAKSTQNYPMYKNIKTDEKIYIFKDKNDVYRYQSVREDSDKGTIKDFMKNRGLTSIDAQTEYLKNPNRQPLQYEDIKTIDRDAEAQKARDKYKTYEKIESQNDYLTTSRDIDFETYRHYHGLRTDAHGSIVTPLYSYNENTKSYVPIGNNKKLSKYYAPKGEIIKDLNEGGKGVGILDCENKPKNVVIVESTIDGLSYVEANGLNPKETLILTTQGQLNAQNLKDIERLCNTTFKYQDVYIATDNDAKGKEYASKLKAVVPRSHIDLPVQKDWNEQLKVNKQYDRFSAKIREANEMLEAKKSQTQKDKNTTYQINEIPTLEDDNDTSQKQKKRQFVKE